MRISNLGKLAAWTGLACLGSVTTSVAATVSCPGSLTPTLTRQVEVSGSDFVIVKDDCGQAVLLPGGSCDVQVSFRAATVGVKSACLTAIASAACGTSEVQASVQGTGVSDGPDVNLAPIDFGSVAVGSESAAVEIGVDPAE